jgi:hypothetical protein
MFPKARIHKNIVDLLESELTIIRHDEHGVVKPIATCNMAVMERYRLYETRSNWDHRMMDVPREQSRAGSENVPLHMVIRRLSITVRKAKSI